MMPVVAIAMMHLLQLLAVPPVLHAATNIALPGCISKCGEVSVPYPFGIGAGCYREGFQLTCNETYNVPKLFVGNTRAEVLYISLHDGKLYINNGVVSVTGSNRYSMTWEIPLHNTIFTVSSVWNNFVVMGCGFDFLVSLPDAESTVVRCSSSCLSEHPAVATDGSCSGVGCCEASMPGASSLYSIELASFQARNHMIMEEQPFNATVVLVEKQWWDKNDHSVLLQKAVSDGSAQSMQIKTAVKWSFSNLSCGDAQSSSDYGCRSYYSYCHDKSPKSKAFENLFLQEKPWIVVATISRQGHW